MINKWLQSDRNASQNKLIASIKLATLTPLQISLTHKILNGMDLLLSIAIICLACMSVVTV